MANSTFLLTQSTADSITTVMTIQQITEKLQKKASTDGERLQFATIVNAVVTEMNLQDLPNVISIKWFAILFALCIVFIIR